MEKKKHNKIMNKNWKTWLFKALILAALLGPVVVGVINHAMDSQFFTGRPVSIPLMPTDVPQTVCVPDLDLAAFELLDTLTLSQQNGPGSSFDASAYCVG